MMRSRALSLFALAAVLAPPGARADDTALRATLKEQIPRAAAAAAAASAARGSADEVGTAEVEYAVARDLTEAVARALPVSAACRPAYEAAAAYGDALVKEAEAVDRLSPGLSRAADRAAALARAGYERAFPSCAASAAARPVPLPASVVVPHEVFFGDGVPIAAAAPAGTTRAVIGVDRRPSCRGRTVRVVDGSLHANVRTAPGRHLVGVAYCGAAGLLARTTPQPVWLLPRPGPSAAPRDDGALSGRLAAVARGFHGWSAVWFQDLRTGRTAAWNADARFPAASTVKLGLLVAALERFGPRSPHAYDIAAMATWSSNLATNRLLLALGGSEAAGAQIVQDTLRRLGAASSTFTGGYRIATASTRRNQGGPPLVSSRVTTARDLARILGLIEAGATGDRQALRTLRLTPTEARLALGLLLDSEPAGENVGLLRPALPRLPIAQKQGWLSVARHTAAVVFAPDGPKLVVVLTDADGLTLPAAQRYAARVLQAVGLAAQSGP